METVKMAFAVFIGVLISWRLVAVGKRIKRKWGE